ncbi:MAG: ATP-binding protein [Candidatus Dormiibacterota bacterium]
MEPRRFANPYRFGSPVAGDHFADRKQELTRLAAVMGSGQNLILIAPRRYGKSSLLLAAMERTRRAGGRTGRVNLIKCSTPEEVAGAILLGAVRGPWGWLRGRTAQLAEHLGRVRIGVEIQTDARTGSVSGVSFAPSLRPVDWRGVILDVLVALGRLASDSHPVSLVLDEFQRAYEIDPGIADVMKAAVDDAPRLSLIFSGSRRHLMEQMVQDPDHGPLYNVGAKLYLGRIPVADFSRFLRSRAEAGGKRLSPQVAERIYQLALGVPNDVQLLAFWAFEQPGEEITEAALAAALRSAIADQRQEYQAVWDGLASSQQRLLKLLAERPLGSLRGVEALQRIALSPTAVAKAGTVLERSDLIRRGEAAWELTSGLMAEWLRGDYD